MATSPEASADHARASTSSASAIARPRARSRRHRLQHRLDAGARRIARALPGALRRHRAGDQAGLRAIGDQAHRGARHAGDRQPRIHPRADPRIRRPAARSRWSARRGSPPSPKPNLPARRSPTPRSPPRSRPALSTPTAAAPTPWCWPARIIRCCSSACGKRALAGRLARSGAGDRAPRRRSVARRARPAAQPAAADHCSPPAARPRRRSRRRSRRSDFSRTDAAALRRSRARSCRARRRG